MSSVSSRFSIFSILFSTFFILDSSVSFGSCTVNLPPLEARVGRADAIFTGFIQSDGRMNPDGEIDSEAFIKVNKVFKGNLEEFAIIQYIGGNPGDCMEDMLRLVPGTKEEMLFFAKKRGHKYFSSFDMGTEVMSLNRAKREIAELPKVISDMKVKAEKEAKRPWWNKFGWFD